MLAKVEPSRSARQLNLTRLLKPRHIAFIGGDRAGWAIKVCRAAGYAGEMYAIHPRKDQLEGVPCVRRVSDLPVAPDATFISVPADSTVEIVGQLARMGAGGAVCYASGFAELGEIGRRRNEALLAAAGDLAIVGPNCFGIINYVNHGSLWSVPYLPSGAERGAAVIGQSGNLCINLSMNQRQVPFSYIISAGNQAVLGFEDYIEALTEDPKVTAIGLFLEGIRDVPAFATACLKAHARKIPLVALRVGVSELGAKVAASHTSSLAGQNELYDTLFERLGIIAVNSVPRFLELLKALSTGIRPEGRRLTVFSSSGGDNGMAADFAAAAQLALPEPTAAQADAVNALLPDYGNAGNPLDFTAGYWGQEELLTSMFTHMLGTGYDMGALVIDHPRPELGPEVAVPMQAMVRALGKASRATGIPGAVACVNPESMPETMRRQVLEEGLIPLQGVHDAFAVLGNLADYEMFCRRIDAGDLPSLPASAPKTIRPGRRILDEHESKSRLQAYGLPVPAGRQVSLAELGSAAEAMQGPFALKALSADLPHKTEAGGVALNLADASAVLAAAGEMRQRVAAFKPGLQIDRFLLEPMVRDSLAEVLVGVTLDRHFGPVLVIGAGGILVELLRDACRLLLPASRSEIEAAIRRLKTFPLLDGFRGRPKADLPALVAAIESVARYAVDHVEQIAEIDVNPIMVLPTGRGVVAADALIVEVV
jgi:acyl-CoA synthetase (NDP forming)